MSNNRRTPTWVWIAVGSAVAAVVLLCLCGGVMKLTAPTPHSTAAAEQSPVQIVQPGPVKTTPPKTIVVKGSNPAVKSFNPKLNGTFQVDYTSSSVCIQIDFLQPNGSDGAEIMQNVNDCSTDINSHAKGSTLVTLTSVSMIKVSNTHGSWTVRFTPVE